MPEDMPKDMSENMPSKNYTKGRVRLPNQMNFWKNSKRRDGWRSEIGKKGDISDPGTSCPALVVAWRQKMQLFARLSSQIVGCRLTRAWTLLSVHFLFTLCNLCFDICVQNMLLVFQYLCSQFRCHHLTCQNYAYVPFLSNF